VIARRIIELANIVSVAPAELEGVLLEHPNIVDAGVIGINSEEEATELPR
jgi:4-coumarate--CoA ligase